ncbi:hypothetical protein LCGC14_2193080, partial [marine sediment metagenome]
LDLRELAAARDKKRDVAAPDDKQAKPKLSITAEARGNRIVVVAADGAETEALKLIQTLDMPVEAETRTYRMTHITPGRIDKLIRSLSETARIKDLYASTIDAESNVLIVTAPKDVHDQLEGLTRELDVPSGVETVTYQLRYVSPRRIDRLVRDLTDDPRAKGLYKSTIDEESGLLIVTGLPTTHERIGSLRDALDVVEADPQLSYVRFYKLTNTTAAQVMSTIRSLDVGEGGLETLALPERAATNPYAREERFSGANYPPPRLGEELPKPPPYVPSKEPTTQPAGLKGPVRSATVGDRTTKVIADANTNTIIVVGPPALQKIYKQLIDMLDKRRPQVMVEVTLVTLDTSDNFSLGVEVSRLDDLNDGDSMLNFSAFGLGTVDQTTGVISLTPGVGFNGVLISPGTFNMVIRALASSGRTQVLAAPRVLVNDNATATLASIAEAPFTSVNASDTVSTTSFAGYASAGTTLTVTPHISEGDHVQLQYSITLNSFTGQGAAGIPPPRQTNTLSSEVTIPDGYAVIVGGLNRKDLVDTVSKIPLLGDIPILKYLFSSVTDSSSQNTLFVFLRPLILRDDQFEDLKYLSARDLKLAQLPSNLPISMPLLVD